MLPEDISDVLRNKAIANNAEAWLVELPALVAVLEHDWQITVGAPYLGGTEAYVAEARLADGTKVVLKLGMSRDAFDARDEIVVLRLTDGDGCVRLLRDDEERNAMLLERLGPSMHELSLSLAERHEALCCAAQRFWRPAPDCGLSTGLIAKSIGLEPVGSQMLAIADEIGKNA